MKSQVAPPFESTRWQTVWLDHLSFGAANYKASASFYANLLGWGPTYDEGSQNELMIGDVGDIIVRGGNPFDPEFGRGSGYNLQISPSTHDTRLNLALAVNPRRPGVK